MREAPIVPRKAHVESRPMSAAVAVADTAAVAAEDWILIVMVMVLITSLSLSREPYLNDR